MSALSARLRWPIRTPLSLQATNHNGLLPARTPAEIFSGSGCGRLQSVDHVYARVASPNKACASICSHLYTYRRWSLCVPEEGHNKRQCEFNLWRRIKINNVEVTDWHVWQEMSFGGGRTLQARLFRCIGKIVSGFWNRNRQDDYSMQSLKYV